jgi:hypothetical protein
MIAVVDLFRLICILTASVLVGVSFHRLKCPTLDPHRKARFVSLAFFGLFSAVQVSQNFGHPMVWWRLPLLLVADSTALYGTLGDKVIRPPAKKCTNQDP